MASTPKPLKVIVMAGQSNMQGHVNVSTFDSMADDPKTAPILKEMRNADGTPRVCERVWISSIGCAGNDVKEQTGKVTTGFGASTAAIGPEFTFGIYLEKRLQEPILLIKTSWGGKTLNTDFRPPSAGPYVFNETQLAAFAKEGKDLAAMQAAKAKETGVYYRLMVDHVRTVLADIKRVVPDYDPAQGYELAGFVWFQGWNDLVDRETYPQRNQPGGYDLYQQVLCDLIRDVRKDLNAPQLPFVIGVMGIGGPTTEKEEAAKPPRYRGITPNFRKAMAAPAALPEFRGTVTAVLTENYWDRELGELQARAEDKQPLTPEEQKRLTGISHWDCHYHGAAKILAPIGKALAEAMADLQKTR
jgi:alpha-galactosidase